jgi:ribonucleoside-diphosphate reductase beta chain
MQTRSSFQVTGPRGLDHSLLPMTLWRKAKKLGTWDPADIDLVRDARDWAALSPLERRAVDRG